MSNKISETDNKKIISVKQLLSSSINQSNYNYIHTMLVKNVKDMNYLYTQVAFLIKLFLLDCLENKNIVSENLIYNFDKDFVLNCFKLISKKNKSITSTSNSENSENSESNVTLIKKSNDEKLQDKLRQFYKKFNNNHNNIKFTRPDNLSSISHIEVDLAKTMHTTIENNITMNYFKYVKEYVQINLNLKFKDNKSIKLNTKCINDIYNDIINNTYYSDIIFHDWIIEHKKLIIPKFNNYIHITSIEEGKKEDYKKLVKFIDNHIKTDNLLNQIIKTNENYKPSVVSKSICNDILNNTRNSDVVFHEWINDNILIIISKFNSEKKINLEKNLKEYPYHFIPYMHFINKNLEQNNSDKKYQIIPLRTNYTPKFIQISSASFIDIIDSKYLLGIPKDTYKHDKNEIIKLFKTYFNFDSDFIKSVTKKGYIFSGKIYTNGYEIVYIFESQERYDIKKIKSNNSVQTREKNKIGTTDKTEQEIKEYYEKCEKERKEQHDKYIQLRIQKIEEIKKQNKINEELLKNNTKVQQGELEKTYNKNIEKLKEYHGDIVTEISNKLDKNNKNYYKEFKRICDEQQEFYKSDEIYLNHCLRRDIETLKIDYNNDIDKKILSNKNKDIKIDKDIESVKKLILLKKKDIKELNKKTFRSIKKSNKKIKKCIQDNNFEQQKIKNLLNKIILKSEKLQYETEDKDLTKNHIEIIKKSIIVKLNDILKIENTFKTKFKTRSFKNFIDKKFNGDIKQLFNCLNTSLTAEYNILLEQIILTLTISIGNKKIIIMEKN